MSRRRARLARLAPLGVAALGVAAALVLGEVLIRVAAWWSPAVREMAGRDGRPRPAAPSLDAYLASNRMHVVPHRDWFNYWNNALGLNDEEFTPAKPAGRFRILAVGDSFTYGLVPYPHAAMTILESALRTACPHRDLEVLNFGIAGAGVEDYRTVITLALPIYAPDLVVVHFYAGNDAPDLYRLVHERAGWRSLARHSRLLTAVTNTARLGRDVEPGLPARARGTSHAGEGATPRRGGTVVDPAYRQAADDPALVGPSFTPTAFDSILAEELRRLYTPPDPTVLAAAWKPVVDVLDAIRGRVARSGVPLALVVYPSVLQLDAPLRAELVARLRQRRRYAPVRLAAIDPMLPQSRLAAYCRDTGLPCVDVAPQLAAARLAAPDAPLYKQRDPHWTIRGNQVAGEAEAAHLAPLVCRGGTPTGPPASRARPADS